MVKAHSGDWPLGLEPGVVIRINFPVTRDIGPAGGSVAQCRREASTDEVVNLAGDLATNRDLILAMNAKLNAIIAEEIGA